MIKARCRTYCTYNMSMMQLVPLLLGLISIQAGTALPYGPHEHPEHQTFFQGWYSRVTTSELSLAVVMGEHVAGDAPNPAELEHPPVLCMVLVQPKGSSQQPLLAYTRYFNSIHIVVDGATASDETLQSFIIETEGQAEVGSDKVGANTFHSWNHSPGKRYQPQRSGSGQPARNMNGQHAKGGSQEYDWCEMKVSKGKTSIAVKFPGKLSMQLHSTGDTSMALPWSSQHISPEGWAGALGDLVGLHYATLSLATPVTLNLTILDDGYHSDNNNKLPNMHQMHESRQSIPLKLNKHMRGMEVDSSREDQMHAAYHKMHNVASHVSKSNTLLSSYVSDGTRLGIRQSNSWQLAGDYSTTGMAHMEAQYGRAFPPRWIWAQGHKLLPNNQAQAFVLVGGDLPHKLSPPLPPLHEFMFSYRDTTHNISVAADPWNPPVPGLSIEEHIRPCDGTLYLELGTMTHVIQIHMKAAPASFTPVACPSESGFVELSVESYTANVGIRVYQRGWLQRMTLKASHWVANMWHFVRLSILQKQSSSYMQNWKKLDAVNPKAPWGSELVVDTALSGAALEWGGGYRCQISE